MASEKIIQVNNTFIPEDILKNPTSFPNQIQLSDLSDPYQQVPDIFSLPEDEKVSIEAVSSTRAAETVGVMRIYAQGKSGSSGFIDNAGHSWLAITNYSGTNLNIGGINVANNNAITLGTWGNVQHHGLWYNLEGYLQNQDTYAWSSSVSIQRPIRQIDLDLINKNLSTHDGWYLWYNCSSFSSSIWNSIAVDSDRVSAGIPNTPGNLAESIKDVGARQSWTLLANGFYVPYDYPTYSGYPPVRNNPQFEDAGSLS